MIKHYHKIKGIRTIIPEENCPPVNFPRGNCPRTKIKLVIHILQYRYLFETISLRWDVVNARFVKVYQKYNFDTSR